MFYKSFVQIVRHIKPKIFVMENVPGIIRLFEGNALKSVVEDFSELGYDVSYSILSSDNYGVPQQRRRVFFVGLNRDKLKNTDKFDFPATIEVMALDCLYLPAKTLYLTWILSLTVMSSERILNTNYLQRTIIRRRCVWAVLAY